MLFVYLAASLCEVLVSHADPHGIAVQTCLPNVRTRFRACERTKNSVLGRTRYANALESVASPVRCSLCAKHARTAQVRKKGENTQSNTDPFRHTTNSRAAGETTTYVLARRRHLCTPARMSSTRELLTLVNVNKEPKLSLPTLMRTIAPRSCFCSPPPWTLMHTFSRSLRISVRSFSFSFCLPRRKFCMSGKVQTQNMAPRGLSLRQNGLPVLIRHGMQAVQPRWGKCLRDLTRMRADNEQSKRARAEQRDRREIVPTWACGATPIGLRSFLWSPWVCVS